MDDVQKYQREIVITKYGKPVAKLVPVKDKKGASSILGILEGPVKIYGDLTKLTGVRWDNIDHGRSGNA
jgi:antitoxin (DNA-binding transcriptional repressor) of toxin-antitoxin stability system